MVLIFLKVSEECKHYLHGVRAQKVPNLTGGYEVKSDYNSLPEGLTLE